MKKRIIFTILMIIMIPLTAVAVGDITQLVADIASYPIFINGQKYDPENPAVVINGRTYLPLREISEALDMTVEWSNAERKVMITEGKSLPKADGSDLIPFVKDGLFGYMDINGKIRIKPQFEEVASGFKDGYALIERDGNPYGKSGLIDINGNVVIPCEYNSVRVFSEGLAVISERKNDEIHGDCDFWFIDKEGKDVFGKTFKYAGSFSCGLAPVLKSEDFNEFGAVQKWTYIDKTGNYATETEFDSAGEFHSNGLAIITKDGKWGVINTNFELVTSDIYDWIWSISENGYIIATKSGKYGLINTNEETMIDFEYEQLYGDAEGLYCAKKDGKVGYVDINNNVIIPFQYPEAWEFSYGIAPVKDENGKWGFINKKGEYVLEPKYDYISVEYSTHGLFQVREGNNRYYIDTKFERVDPHD